MTAPSTIPRSTTSGSRSVADMYERALTLAAMGLYEEATKALREVTVRGPDHGPAWQKYGALLGLAASDREADAALARAAVLGAQWPPASDERSTPELDTAENVLRGDLALLSTPVLQIEHLRMHLRGNWADVAAMRLLARAERDRGNLPIARELFERALYLAPGYDGAREDLVMVLRVLREDARALGEARSLLARLPKNVIYRVLYADALRGAGDHEAALAVLEELISEDPGRIRLRLVHAQILHFAGRTEDSAREFRALLELRPDMGEAWWGLAELRRNYLTRDDSAAMRGHLRNPDLDRASRMPMQYALGHALEEEGDFAGSFAAYEACAGLAREVGGDRHGTSGAAKHDYDVRRCRAVFTERLLSANRPVEVALPDATPIFIVGMPRAGSTLVEQILASHRRVEATMELPVLGNIIRDLSRSRVLVDPDAYPECVTDLTPRQLAELGLRYINNAALYRKTERPWFVDKAPWNWRNAGFIRMILPQAKIVDVRREPLAACLAMYKQRLDDVGFSNDFESLAAYYTQYAGLMAHYGRVMPGAIHFLSYERLVEDTENEIRGLLDYCGLPFDEACLQFWKSRRTVPTPSAEQVRRPIYRTALQQWRNFEPWLGPLKEALKTAETAAAAAPQPEGFDLGLTLAAMSVYEDATRELREVTRRVPTHPGAWSKLAELLRFAGRDNAAANADAAAARHASKVSEWQSTRDLRSPAQLEAAGRAWEKKFAGMDRADRMHALRLHLMEKPTDVAAIHMLSDLEFQDLDKLTSLALLQRTVELSPLHLDARKELAVRLLDHGDAVAALGQTTILAREDPANPMYILVHSDALRSLGKFAAAVQLIEDLLRRFPRHPRLWLRYGELLRHVGRREESVRALRTCLEIAPTNGDAYAALADLKGNVLTDADVTTMRAHLAEPGLDPSSRMHMYYALGNTLEGTSDFAGSFAAYEAGARLFRGFFLGRGESYHENDILERVGPLKRFYTARFFSGAARAPDNPAAATPIFVVGMPRAGSTLVEQILSSHSQVEGTRELALMGEIVYELNFGRRMLVSNAYPECVRRLGPAELAAIGERYLDRARAYRKTARPFFVDKRPWNWLDAGLIHLILPQAKIIDIRREPMAACFAMFKQLLPRDCNFSYDLGDVARYYNVYVGLMQHWQSVLPDRIHFVQYERLVEDTENEIRRMLEHCGLPFEESCLRFWQTERMVLTPSAEQVRRPIYRDAVEQWRNFEPWLGPLKAALSEPPRT